MNPKRKAFIEKLGLDLEKDYLKPKPFNFTPPKDAYSYRWEMVTFLSDFIHSLNAKFELLFESGGAHFISPSTSFTTEKLLKYFWWPHPSIIVLPQFVIDKFETYGFKFPHNGYNESESDASGIRIRAAVSGTSRSIPDATGACTECKFKTSHRP